jgi:hypothetical protein
MSKDVIQIRNIAQQILTTISAMNPIVSALLLVVAQ